MAETPRPAVWSRAAARPVLAILAIVAAQYALTLWSKDLWFADEARHGAVLRDLIEGGHWLALHMNGELYPDKPPLYFWYMAAIWRLFGTTEPWAIYLGIAGTAAMFYGATFHMARRILGDAGQALLAVVILASGIYLNLSGHYARMDLAFSAAIVLAWTQLYLGLAEGLTRRSILVAFAFMGLAAMIKGPVGLLFPMLTLVGFVLWQRRPGVLLDRSVLGGLALVAGIIGLWAGGLILAAGPGFLAHLFETQIVDRGLSKTTTPLGPLYYLIFLPVNFLPWTLLVLVLPRSAFDPRRVAPDTAFLWISVLAGALALTLISEKHTYYMIPLLAPLAILAAKGYVRIEPRGLVLFWRAALGLMAVIGTVLIFAPALVNRGVVALGDYTPAVQWFWLPGLVLAGGALALATRAGWPRELRAAGFLGLQAGFVTAVALTLFPGINRVLSPSQVTDVLQPYIAEGYSPTGFHGRDGAFAYHLGMHYHDAHGWVNLDERLKETPKAVVFMTHSDWWPAADRFPTLGPVDCVRMVNRGMIVLLQPAPDPPLGIDSEDCAGS